MKKNLEDLGDRELIALAGKLESELEMVLSREQIADFLNISLASIDRLLREKAIPCVRVRGRVLFLKSTIVDWLKGKLEAPAPPDWERILAIEKMKELIKTIKLNNRLVEIGRLLIDFYRQEEEGGLAGLSEEEKKKRERMIETLRDEERFLKEEREKLSPSKGENKQ